jgi:TolB-like protein
MADVFISYAHTTGKQAQAAAVALRAAGYSVWLDDDLAVHRAFTQAIEEQLTAAKAALVIWSADAARSEWVLSEANRAREDRKLVQLVIDKTRLPMPFDQVQCADLAGWTGETEHPNWRRVTASIHELVEARSGSSPLSLAVARAPNPASAERRLAVLPFDNLSPDPEMGFFSDGVSEEILETVSRNTDLQVISRTSSFQFRGASKTTRHVAAELNVSHLLDGSVRRSGQRVRVSAQLVECATEARIWSQRFDRELDDVFALQDEIAAAVSEALKAEFSRAGPSPGKLDPAAYDLFLRARDLTISRHVSERIPLLEQCVALAPDFAPGWAALAHFRALALSFESGAIEPRLQAALTALATAEGLDPTLGLTRVARASLEPIAAYQRREAHLVEALRLTPNDAATLVQVALLVGEVGRHSEALEFSRQAMTLDPQHPSSVARWLVMLDTDYDEQAPAYDAARAKWPANMEFSVTASTFAGGKGDWARYEMLKQHALAQPFAEDSLIARVMRNTFRYYEAVRDGDNAYSERASASLARHVETTGAALLEEFWSTASMGHVDAAFEAVERARFDNAFELGRPSTSNWWRGTLFQRTSSAALIDDPRFPRLCAKLGLVAYWLDTDRWPDCADQVTYDFRAECRKAAAEGLARRVSP